MVLLEVGEHWEVESRWRKSVTRGVPLGFIAYTSLTPHSLLKYGDNRTS